MYLTFYGLADKPLSITPDPRYLFLGGRHAEALAHLVYGITDAGGFIQLTGEVGTGKTTVIRSLLARKPDNAEIALILNPHLDAPQFLQTICEELGIALPASATGNLKELIDQLNRHLLKAHAAGRRVVVIVDEAQNLAADVLEQVRLLTNLETETQKLLQIILIGQPELRTMLERNDLRQLAQRITGRYHLEPLSRAESAAYLRHRLRIAGATQEIFTRGALAELYRASGGIPRLLNVIGDRALLGGYTEDRHVVNAALARRAASEVSGRRVLPAWLPWLVGGATVVLLATTTWFVWNQQQVAAAAKAKMAAAAAAAAKPPPIQAPAPPDLLTLLHQAAAMTDLDGAYARLFSRWNARYVAGSEDACSQALRQGLQCVNESGGAVSLRRYNRPAILALQDDTGAVHQTVATKLGDDSATLMIGDAEHEVPLADVSTHWNGDFLLLWKPAQLDTRSLSMGMEGAPVLALRQRLQQWANAPAETGMPEVFDESLRQLVLQFQQRNGLITDGVAGTRTQALLDAQFATADTPQLTVAR
ncbi:MAG: AAA family ATPase [Pseudomonadota bacterium]